MPDKAVISEYSHHTIEAQRKASGDMPVFILPDDLNSLFRATTRRRTDVLHVEGFNVLADTEPKFRNFLALAKECKAQIHSREDNQTFAVNGNCENLVKWWKDSRRRGSAIVGAQRGADKKKAAVAERCKALTKAEWTNGAVKNAQLVGKYGASINAMKRYASSKGWGWDRQKAIWEAGRRKAKAS